jgi:eukaryotic-like serine/threonine-protein kinase
MPANLQKARELFLHAVGKLPPDQWDRYVTEASDGDSDLEKRVRGFLQVHREAGSFLESPAAPLIGTIDEPIRERPGTVIGPYKLLEQIGEGGFGVVFMAEQSQPVRRKVALKVLKPGMDTRQVIARFEAERQALAIMDHPNIAHVFDGGETAAGRPYFVMELVHGIPITEFCDQNHLPVRERLALFVHVCQAVQHAHQKGIIHRDLKPTNILVTLHDDKPVVKVIDFGIAKAAGQQLTEKTLFTNFAQMIGTPLYMSPEQAQMSGLDVDTRSDIYSLGVLLYELLTGTTPFDKERLRTAAYDEIRRIIREEEPPKPSTRLSTLGQTALTVSANRKSDPRRLRQLFRGELDWIVMKSLEKDRNRRYETATNLAADVQRYLDDEPVLACPPSATYRLRKFARRNRRPVTAGLALTTVLVLGTVGTSIGLAWALRAEHKATAATGAEILAKDKLNQTLDNELVDAYFRRIALAYRELSADNLHGALELLNDCPEDLRKGKWEWNLLMRLCRVDPVVLRNGAGVTSLAFSADGERIATAGMDGTLKVWNSRTAKVTWFIEKAHGDFAFRSGFASSVTFHPGGNHLASTGQDGLVKVWDLTADRTARPFSRPCDAVQTVGTAYAAAFNPLNPNHLAVGSEGAVTIWDWRSEKLVHAYPKHPTQRLTVAFSRDGRRLASGDWGGNVKLWNGEAGSEPLRSFPDSRYPVAAVSFSPDAGRLAAASFDRYVDVWNTTTGERVHQLPHKGRLVMAVAFSPDPAGRLIASTGEDKTVHIWHAETGREVLGLRGHTRVAGCLAFSPDGLRLASASTDGTIRVWDATPLEGHEGQELFTLPEQSGEVWSLALSPNGQKIASGGHRNPAKVWDVGTRQATPAFPGIRDVVFCVAWHPDGQRIAYAGGNGDQFSVKVWNIQSEREESPLPVGLEYPTVAFSTDPSPLLRGRYLVTGRSNGKVQLWDARDGRGLGEIGTHIGPVRVVAFSPDGRFLASASADGVLKLWDATRLGEIEKTGPQEPRHKFTTHVPGPCSNVAFSPDGKRIAIGDTENTVAIREVETGKELATLRGHSGDVFAVAFSPDGRLVASAGEDSTVKVWDSQSGKLIRSFRGHRGLVNSLAFTPDGQRLVSGSRDRMIKFWDVTQLRESKETLAK